MFGYLWPANQPRLRFLLILTVAAMAIGQLVLFATPILFSKIIDAFQFGALGLGFWDLLWAISDQLAADAKSTGSGIGHRGQPGLGFGDGVCLWLGAIAGTGCQRRARCLVRECGAKRHPHHCVTKPSATCTA